MVDISLRDKSGGIVEKPTGEPQWAYWKEVIDATETWLNTKHWNGRRRWRAAYMHHRGKQWNSFMQSQESHNTADSSDLDGAITVNKTGSFIQDLLPFLVRREPSFLGKPERPQDLESARAQGELLSKAWRKGKMNRQLKLCALDALICGHGIAKTGFNREIDQAKASSKKGQAAAPEGLEYRDYIKKESAYFYRVSPFRFLIDSAAPSHDLESARWCGEIIFRPYQDVIEDSRYDKETIKEIKAGKPATVRDYASENQLEEVTVGPEEEQQEIDTLRDYLVLYEIWDKRSRKNFVFCRGIERPLLERDWPYPNLSGFPYAMVKFEEIPNELYGTGIPHKVADLQKMLNRTRSKQFAMARAYSPQMYGPPLDEAEKDKLQSKNADEYIQLDETQSANQIRAVPHPILPADFYQLEASIQADFRELTSMDALIQGGPLPARTSATEVRSRQQLFGLKLEDSIQALDHFVLEIGQQLLQHFKQFMVQEVWIEQLGRRGKEYVAVTSDMIKAQVDIELISTNKEPIDPQVEKQQALQLLQIVSQAVPALFQVHGMQAQAIQQGMIPEPGLVDVGQLMYYIAEKFEIDDIDRIFPGMSMEPTAGAEFTEWQGPRPNFLQSPGQPAAADPGQPGAAPPSQQANAAAGRNEAASSFSNSLGPGSIPEGGVI
jgi:hypothetical protein